MTGGDGGLCIVLLGRFELRSQGVPLIDHTWSRGKAKALLKVLALAEGRALHREQVMELLWPDLAPAVAANQLRKNLHYLRAELDRRGTASPVTAAHDLVCLAPDVQIDVEVFRELAAAARKDDDPAIYERALQAGEGELLPEEAFEEWSQAPRQELRTLRLRLLTELAALHRAAGRPERAAELLHRVLAHDPVDEAAHRSLIEISVSSGNRTLALQQYQSCRDALRRELGVEPSATTESLYREVLTGGLASSSTPVAERAVLLEELGDVIRRAGDAARCAPLYEEAVALWDQLADPAQGARVRGKAILAHILGGEIRAAGRLLDTTRAALSTESPPLVTGRTHYLLAQLRWHSGRYATSLDAAERALAAARASGDPHEQARAYEVLALACHALGDWQRGMAYELQRQALAVDNGFDVDEALESHLCLWEYHLYGDRPYTAVEASVQLTLERAESMGNVRAMAVCQHALGSVHFLMGQWTASRAELERSVRLARSVGAGQGEVIGSQRLGLLETATGRFDEAHTRLRAAVATARASPSFQVRHHSFTRTFAALAQNRLQAGELAAAVGYLQEAATILQDTGDCITCDGLIHPVAVPIYLATGETERAEAACGRTEALAVSFRGRARAAGAHHVRGLVAAKSGDLPLARTCLSAAAATFDELAQPYDAARSLQALATLGRGRGLAATGDLAQRAQDLYDRIGATPKTSRSRTRTASATSSTGTTRRPAASSVSPKDQTARPSTASTACPTASPQTRSSRSRKGLECCSGEGDPVRRRPFPPADAVLGEYSYSPEYGGGVPRGLAGHRARHRGAIAAHPADLAEQIRDDRIHLAGDLGGGRDQDDEPGLGLAGVGGAGRRLVREQPPQRNRIVPHGAALSRQQELAPVLPQQPRLLGRFAQVQQPARSGFRDSPCRSIRSPDPALPPRLQHGSVGGIQRRSA
ncbi:MAG: BTAD domain-containing putative transcriptional regulator [Pseudonocardiaceae bacterium]